MKWVTNKIEKATGGATIFSVIHIFNDVSRDQICIIWWYTLVTKLIIQLRNKNHVSQNLTLVIRLSNENPVSPNLSLVIRCGDTVIRSLFSKFTFATVNLNVIGWVLKTLCFLRSFRICCQNWKISTTFGVFCWFRISDIFFKAFQTSFPLFLIQFAPARLLSI